MNDPLWQFMDSSKLLKRDELELAIQKKKINEVYNWFQEHFVRCSQAEYISRCPIVILQGSTGCGKTSTLRWISNELKIPIKEYSETTDLTAIMNFALPDKSFDEEDKVNTIQASIRRRALKFEHFVINSIRYNTLYPTNEQLLCEDADSEFDSDDEFDMISSLRPMQPPPVSGVIIHIETPITFAKTQRVLIQSLCRLLKVIKDISRHLLRRVAIVFETLEGESETISLPTKIKLSFGIQVFKFNPITRANMKKLIESLVKKYNHIVIGKETIEQLINDCDGDIRACINTLQLIICNKPQSINVLNGIDNISIDRRSENVILPFNVPVNKKQKLHHEKQGNVKLDHSLMRDNTRSLSFFHILGKIFYQKRLYPEYNGTMRHKSYKSIERPFPTENSTEYLVNMLDTDPMNIIAWLHQHYYKFCGESNIEKAALFLENLSIVDTTSLNSTQSTQFYEMHQTLDQLQVFIAIESTVFSLYEDQSKVFKSSYKKTLTDKGCRLIKSSVESFSYSSNNCGDLYSFNKPVTMSLSKLVGDYQCLLDCCATKLIETTSARVDSTKILVDYIPYLSYMSDNFVTSNDARHSIFDNTSIIKMLAQIEDKPEVDFETRHEKLLEMIEEIE